MAIECVPDVGTSKIQEVRIGIALIGHRGLTHVDHAGSAA